MNEPMLFDQDEVEAQIRAALETDQLQPLRPLLSDLYAQDLADVLERLDADDRMRVFELLETEFAAEVLHELGVEATRQLVDDLPPEQAGDLLDLLPMDDVVELLTEDVPGLREELLAEMEPEDASEVIDLLQYPPRSAGRLMTRDFVRLRPEMTREETLAYLRQVDPDVETLNDLYVLNGAKNGGNDLIGVLSLRDLIVARDGAIVRDIMETELITVPPEMDREDVARLVSRYDFLALPVVRDDGRMLGIVTVDDIIDVLVQEGTRDALRFGGVEGGPIDQPYFTTPLRRVIRSRLGWLLLLFLAETFTGSVLRLFERQLAEVVALSFFIPLLIGTGGNTGAQTVSTIIRGLALKEIRQRDLWRVIRRELLSGLLIGLLLGMVSFIRAELWGSGSDLSLVVGLTIVAICTWANTIGALIPLLAQRLKIDPAIVSAPLITTLVDATGLAIYLSIATVIMGL